MALRLRVSVAAVRREEAMSARASRVSLSSRSGRLATVLMNTGWCARRPGGFTRNQRIWTWSGLGADLAGFAEAPTAP